MRELLSIEVIPTDSLTWPSTLAEIRALLGAPKNALLFPPLFLESAFPKIGGLALTARRQGEPVAYAFLFPRGLKDGRRIFTVRCHPVFGIEELDVQEILSQAAKILPDADLIGYDPRAQQPYKKSEILADHQGVAYSRPDAGEAAAARRLQREIWHPLSDDGLYPTDLYSMSFGAATSLVAQAGEKVVGFLFGFYKFGGLPLPRAWSRYEGFLRIESQVAGVDPDRQGQGIGFLLKKLQGEQSGRDGIDIINWTVDPLQSRNASLNFKKLRAVSFRFLPGHYALRSQQNLTRASRLEITWLVSSTRAGAASGQLRKSGAVQIEEEEGIAIVNDDLRRLPFDRSAPRIAIEIPGDWDTLQRRDIAQAERWRDSTDDLLQDLLGPEDGRYMITDTGERGARRYLIAQRIGPDFPPPESGV